MRKNVFLIFYYLSLNVKNYLLIFFFFFFFSHFLIFFFAFFQFINLFFSFINKAKCYSKERLNAITFLCKQGHPILSG